MITLSYEKPVKANKLHRCNYCTYLIVKGEIYNTSSHKFDGEIYTWKAHLKCSEIASKLKMFDYADEGVTADFFQEYIQEEYQNIMSKTQTELYESKGFNYPKFNQQLEFVINHHLK